MVAEGSRTILLVDDEADFITTLAERLETRGLPAEVVFSGEAALLRFDGTPPEAMVLDLCMPGMDGLEVMRRLHARQAPTQVIILTGHGSDAERRRAVELGVFAYLTKPVEIDVHARTLRAALAKYARAEEAVPA